MSNLILRRWLDLTKRQGSKSRRSGNKTKGGWAWRGRSRKFQSKGSLARVIGLAPMPLMSTMLLPPSELCVPGPRRNLCTPEAYAFVSEGLYHKFGGSNGMAWVNPLVTRVQKILFSYLSGSETKTFSNPTEKKRKERVAARIVLQLIDGISQGRGWSAICKRTGAPSRRKLSLLLFNLAMAIKKVKRCGSEVD